MLIQPQESTALPALPLTEKFLMALHIFNLFPSSFCEVTSRHFMKPCKLKLLHSLSLFFFFYLFSPLLSSPPWSVTVVAVFSEMDGQGAGSAVGCCWGRGCREGQVARRLCTVAGLVKLIDEKGKLVFLAGWGFILLAALIHLSSFKVSLAVVAGGAAIALQGCYEGDYAPAHHTKGDQAPADAHVTESYECMHMLVHSN